MFALAFKKSGFYGMHLNLEGGKEGFGVTAKCIPVWSLKE